MKERAIGINGRAGSEITRAIATSQDDVPVFDENEHGARDMLVSHLTSDDWVDDRRVPIRAEWVIDTFGG